MNESTRIHGLLAEFGEAEALLNAVRRTRAAGYTHIDAFSPFRIEGMPEALNLTSDRVPLATLCGGVFGGMLAYFMLWYVNVVDYPMNVGGRPFHSWPAFIPITFELTVLFAAFGAVLGMLIFNRLPQLYHPIFGGKRFDRASQDRFFLLIERTDPTFDLEKTRLFLESTYALEVSLVEEEES